MTPGKIVVVSWSFWTSMMGESSFPGKMSWPLKQTSPSVSAFGRVLDSQKHGVSRDWFNKPLKTAIDGN